MVKVNIGTLFGLYLFYSRMIVQQNEVNNYNWLIKTLSKSCKYPPKLQKKNREGMVYVTYKLDGNGYITNPQVISCNNRKFKRAALNAFNAVTGISITLPAPKDTLVFNLNWIDRQLLSTLILMF